MKANEMKVNELLNEARQKAIDNVWSYYLDLAEGDEAEAKDWLEEDRESGDIDRKIKSWTLDNIYDAINEICKSTLYSDDEKEAMINEIHECPEYQESEDKIARMFANHIVRYAKQVVRCRDTYLK
jgi:hypothetical protein